MSYINRSNLIFGSARFSEMSNAILLLFLFVGFWRLAFKDAQLISLVSCKVKDDLGESKNSLNFESNLEKWLNNEHFNH